MTVDWEQLETELGADMVSAIRHLSSDEKDVRSLALNDLFDLSWHQGSLLWRAAFAVPFLIEHLQRESEEDLLYRILIDLAHIGTGTSFCDLRKDSSLYASTRNTPEFQEQMEEELYWMEKTYEAVYKGVDVYLNLLEHDAPKARIGAAYTLSCCKADAARICDRMRDRFHKESEEMVKATLPLSLAILSNNTPLEPAFFEEVLDANSSRDIVKLSAAIALAYIPGTNMSENARQTLVHLIEKPDLFVRLCNHYENHMATAHNLIVSDFLWRLNDEQMAHIIPVLAQKVEELPYGYKTLIELAFQDNKLQEGITIHELTESQQFVLRAIANDDRLWKLSNYFISSILKDLGIKGSPLREKLIRFLNGDTLHYDP
ncbi:hypothetical protein [Microseira wollei]|uniref:HEAT repeat domain-containing protein n=1 Tax=Microseira wollei NIES-4236 TaxID=2530354 RepID=A0AAV3XJ40_9CYAN|nr:hypothetical protein [Microseira wollei]GET40544.1 hypothetical protein MiSe_53540 [Microseira wollei NIES-4236]